MSRVIEPGHATLAGEPKSPVETVLRAALGRHRRQIALRIISSRVLLAIAVGGLTLLVPVAADHIWPGGLPPVVRAVGLILWVGLLGAICALGATVALLRRLNAVYVAQDLERARGIRHNAVINALLLWRRAERTFVVRPALRQAAREVLAHPADGPPAPVAGRVTGALLLAGLVAWIAYILLSPKPVTPSLARFFGSEQAAPTATRLELLHPGPDEAVHIGEATELVFAVHGRQVESLRLEILAADPPHTKVVREIQASVEHASPDDDGTGRFGLAPFEVQGDIHFRCSAGDARLVDVIRVQPLPAIQSIHVFLQPPAYTGRLPYTVTDPDLEVPVGTLAGFRLTANTPLRDPIFIFRGTTESRIRMRSDPAAATDALADQVLNESGTYRFAFSDAWGYPFRDNREYRITVVGDAPPTVRIIDPPEGALPEDRIDVRRVRELVAVAADDIGLSGATLVVEREAGPVRAPLGPPSGTTHTRSTYRVPTDTVSLRPGETARAWVEVTDNRVLPNGQAAPQTGRSRTVTLVNPAPRKPGRKGEEAAGDDSPPCDNPGSGSGQAKADGSGQADSTGDGQSQGDGSGESSDSSAESPSGGDAQGSDAGDFEGELDRFVEQHGDEAEAVRRRLGQEPNTSQPADSEQKDNPPSAGQQEGESNSSGQVPPKPQPSPAGGDSTNPPQSGDPQNGDNKDAGGAPPAERESSSDSSTTTAGRSTGSGDSDEAKADGDAAVQPQPPDAPPTSSAGAIESTGRSETLDLLEMLRRGARVTEDMLIDLGWPPEKASAFVRDLERLRAAAPPATEPGNPGYQTFDTQAGTTARQAGGDAAASDTQADADTPESSDDGLERRAQPGEERVPPSLRDLLEAYYRTLARRRAADGN